METYLYDTESCFTVVTNEKTKLLFIDKEGFNKYLRADYLSFYNSIFQFYRS
jgi:hypothetical protein